MQESAPKVLTYTEGAWPFSMGAWKPFKAKDQLKGVLEAIEKTKQTTAAHEPIHEHFMQVMQ